MGDHWDVSASSGMVAGLQRKQYSRFHFAFSFLLIPGIIFAAGFAIYLVTAKPEALWAGLAASFAAGLPMYYIYRTEKSILDIAPINTYVLRHNGDIEIQGKTYQINTLSDLTLEYTYYQSSGAQGEGGHSELDVVLAGGETECRINLLSQTSDWALKHTRKLEQLTGLQVKRTSVAR